MDEVDQARADGDLILSTPAPYANKIFSTVTPVGMRLTFIEHNPGTPTGAARSAVLLGFEDVEALINLLQQQMSHVKKVPLGKSDAGA